MRRLQPIHWLFGLLLMVGASCTSLPPTNQPTIEITQTPNSVLQTSNSPVLLSVTLPPLPPPTATDSAEFQAELAELRAVRQTLNVQQRKSIQFWDGQGVLRWNELARELTARYTTNPVRASQIYAVVSLAQYEALRSAQNQQRTFNRILPDNTTTGVEPLLPLGNNGSYPSDHAALAAASAAALTYFFASDRIQIEQLRTEHQETRLWAGVSLRSDLTAGDQLGRAIAAQVIEQTQARVATDVSWVVPEGAGFWMVGPESQMGPLEANWSRSRPWFLERPDQFRPPPPPVFGSDEFKAALNEVQTFVAKQDPEYIRIAKYWEDGRRTATPSGHWNTIAAETLLTQQTDLLTSARILAFMNMAMMDASIAVWDAKYTYWYIRPYQADPQLKPILSRPPHPSYPSGHAGFSGAAAAFLGEVFPEQRATFAEQAKEASLSRVYGGIHFRFDCDAGLALGQQIGTIAAQHYQNQP
jgi:membrane-associated phospholipid phosphatase